MGAEHWAWLGAGILSAFSLIVLLGNASGHLKKFWDTITFANLRKEFAEMKEWREDLEEEGPMKEWRKHVDSELVKTDTTVKSFDGAYHVLFQSLLALLDHGIDGNNIKQMEDAKDALQSYLINK